MIGLVLPLLLPTPTICFSLVHKWIVSEGVVSEIRTITTPTSSSLVKTSLYVPRVFCSNVTSFLARCSRCILQIDSSTSGADPEFLLIRGSNLWFGILKRTDHLRVPSQNYIFFKYAWNLIVPKGTARFNEKSTSWIVICDPTDAKLSGLNK